MKPHLVTSEKEWGVFNVEGSVFSERNDGYFKMLGYNCDHDISEF